MKKESLEVRHIS